MHTAASCLPFSTVRRRRRRRRLLLLLLLLFLLLLLWQVESHGATGSLKPRVDADVEEEYNRHREFLTKSVKQMKRVFEANAGEHSGSSNDIMKANLELIAEINKQRDSTKQLKRDVQARIGQIRCACVRFVLVCVSV